MCYLKLFLGNMKDWGKPGAVPVGKINYENIIKLIFLSKNNFFLSNKKVEEDLDQEDLKKSLNFKQSIILLKCKFSELFFIVNIYTNRKNIRIYVL